MERERLHYLEQLAELYPTIGRASTEIINLQSILYLPKGTEHFLSDIHGEYRAFSHVLRNGSGAVRKKIDDVFGHTLSTADKMSLATLIYYPQKKIELVKQQEEDMENWYKITLYRLIEVCKTVSSKYTRSKVRKALPEDYAYVIEELITEKQEVLNKEAYYEAIVNTIVELGQTDNFIVALAELIQRLVIDHLHILGDVYDRGPSPDLIMDRLEKYHSFDIQWGNHDILWMGACAGNDACICNVIRIALRYANLVTLEEGYGINLMRLATFAMETYGEDPCEEFMPKVMGEDNLSDKNRLLIARMHKAITVLQFKTEAQLISRNPQWDMDDRMLMNTIDFAKGTCKVNGAVHKMTSCCFPTVNPECPTEMTPEERSLMEQLHHSFLVSEKLRKHVIALLRHGCMYAVYNNNLLFHASIPLNSDGTLKDVELWHGEKYSGKALMHHIGMIIRTAFQNDAPCADRQYSTDFFLYLWCGKDSPLFDKSKMATFERYFITDKTTHVEDKGNYFKLRNNEEIMDMILDAFGITGENRHVINGHVPVHVVKGENPIKANGKLMVIDGGFSEPFHKETGIAGYTLVYHSRGFQLVQHEPFTSAEDAIRGCKDIKSTTLIVEMSQRRMMVADTDKGQEIKHQIAGLKELLYAYRHGVIKEMDIKQDMDV